MRTKAAEAKPVLSGFCNPSLPRTAAYDPHERCSGCRCSCHDAPPLVDESTLTCAECGTTEAKRYVVTVLDPTNPRETRTEVCGNCDELLRHPGVAR